MVESAPALVRGSAKCIYPNVKPQYNAEISEIQIFFIKTSKKSKFLIDILLPSWYYVNAVSDSTADQAFRLCLVACKNLEQIEYADVAELADALDSGSSECKFMWVQVPSSAP